MDAPTEKQLETERRLAALEKSLRDVTEAMIAIDNASSDTADSMKRMGKFFGIEEAQEKVG